MNVAILMIVSIIYVWGFWKITAPNAYLFPLKLYLGWWFVWVAISITNPFGVDNVTLFTYSLILIHIVAFSVGFLIACPRLTVRVSKECFTVSHAHYRIMLVINIILGLVLYKYWSSYNRFLAIRGVIDARNIVFEPGLLFGSYLEVSVYNTIIIPLISVTQIICIIQWINFRKITFLSLLMIVNTFFISGIGLGRFIILDIATYYVVISIIYYLMINVSKKSNFIILRFIINAGSVLLIAGVILIFITAKRIGAEGSINAVVLSNLELAIEQCIIYFIGAFRALNQYLSDTHVIHNWGFGRASLGGLEQIINDMLLLFNKNLNFSITNEIAKFTVPSIHIGNGHLYNAFYTCIMPFFVDAGVAGVVIISAIYGMSVAKMLKYFLIHPSPYSLALLTYIIHSCLRGQIRYQFLFPGPWVVIGILFILQKNVNICKIKMN